MRPLPLLAFPLLAACATAAPAEPPTYPPLVAATAPLPSAMTSSTNAAGPTPAAPATPPSFEAEAHELLDAMLRVDTSQGSESILLAPVAARLRAAGVAVELLESGPGRGNLVARLKGNGSKKPLLLLAHVDVVPVEGQPWTSPAFEPSEKDGFLTARGVGDDKGMAAAATAIVLELARTKTVLSRDVILALTAGEEMGGDAGVRFLADNHRALIDAELVLNEGGSLQLSPDQSALEAVLVSVGEKTFQSFQLVARGKGGHSSQPPGPAEDPVLRLSRALTRVGEHRFGSRLSPAARGVLGVQAKYEPGALGQAMARVAKTGKLSAADDKLISADKIYNALLRTTCVTTMLKAAPQENVLPTSAEATVNCRILPEETPEATLAALQKLIADPTLELSADRNKGYAPGSPVEGVVLSAVTAVTARLYPGVPVVPSLTLGATDSRHLRVLGMQAYGVAATPLSLDEARAGHGAHGPDERRPVAFLAQGARWLRELTLELAR